MPALEGGRRAAQHAYGAGGAGAHNGDFARVVARRFALLVAGFVLLIDDDRPEVPDGREDGGPRTDRDAARALMQSAPRVVPLAVAQRRMQDRNGIAEVGPEA